MQHDRFHGRREAQGRQCNWPGCEEPGEFRAPGVRAPGFDGPGDYRWFCLDHVRAFNAGYDYFAGMSPEEIYAAQSPLHGWQTETRAFGPNAGIDAPPRWADFTDPLEEISARARMRMPAARKDGIPVTPAERRALEALACRSMPTGARSGSAIANWCAAITRTAMAATGALRRGCKGWSKPISYSARRRRSGESRAG